MDRQERNELHSLARQRLAANTVNPRKLIAIHTGVVLLLTLLLSVMQYLLEQQIGSTGGIGGMGTRAMLSTAQYVLQITQLVLIPVWEMGIAYTALKIAWGEEANLADLPEGFRRIFPVLRLHFIRTALFVGVGFISMYLGSSLFFATPFAAPILQQLAPHLTGDALQDPAALQELLTPILEENTLPLMIFMLLVFAALSLPLIYRYRLASFYLLDETDKGALYALRSSRKLMRFLCFDFFKLDLKFWLFYVLDLLITAVGYGDLILDLLGITLPVNADFAYFAFLIIYAVLQFALYSWKRGEVEVTYATAYCSLRQRFDPLQENKQTP